MDIIETLTRKGQELADKAKDIYDVNKINMMIHNEEKQMNRRYIALAKKYLRKYEDDIDPEFIDDVESIQQHKENIDDYKLQRAVVRGDRICTCGKPVDIDSGYCQSCGRKL